jgi:hypothetical protein
MTQWISDDTLNVEPFRVVSAMLSDGSKVYDIWRCGEMIYSAESEDQAYANGFNQVLRDHA